MQNKRNSLFLAIALLVFISVACSCGLSGLTSGPTVVGTWQGTYDGYALEFIFESSGDFVFNVDGDEVGRGQYVVDESIFPIGLDLYYSDGMNVYSIIEFPDSNTMRMENADPEEARPTSFSDVATLLRVTP